MTPTPAGFWRRFAAHIIDFFIIALVIWVPLWLIFGKTALVESSLLNIVPSLFIAAYSIGFLASKYQATPGKRLMGVYVVRAEDHMPLDVKSSALRYIVYMFPYLLLMFLQPSPDYMTENLPRDEQNRFAEIQAKIHSHETVTNDEQKFVAEISAKNSILTTAYGKILMIAQFYMIVIALMVALTKEKTGLHDVICKTRAVRGRPGVPTVV